jgi:hypothetical protein
MGIRNDELMVIDTGEVVLDMDLRIMPPEAFGFYMRLLLWIGRKKNRGLRADDRKVFYRLAGAVTKGEIRRFDAYWEEYICAMFVQGENGEWFIKPADFLVGSKPKVRGHISIDIRRKILARGECNYCGSPDSLVVDHIRPVKHGGTAHFTNLQCLCWSCNSKKRDKWSGSMQGQTKEFALNG